MNTFWGRCRCLGIEARVVDPRMSKDFAFYELLRVMYIREFEYLVGFAASDAFVVKASTTGTSPA